MSEDPSDLQLDVMPVQALNNDTEEMLNEIIAEANRQDRSLSWIVQKAWKIARKEIMKYPSVNEGPEGDKKGA